MIAPEPFFSPRGTPMSVYYRINALSKLGHQVDLLTYPMGQEVEIAGLRVIRGWRVPFIYDIGIGPSLKKLLLDALLFVKATYILTMKKYDLLFLHEEAVFFGLIARSIFRIKYIYDMHSSLPQQLKNFRFTNSRPLIKFFWLLEKYSLMKASAIITICHDLQEQVRIEGYEDKHELIQNTLFYPIIYSEDSDSVDFERIVNVQDRKIVIYAGSFEPYQGLDMYIDAIRIVLNRRSDVLFVLIGGGPKQILAIRNRAYGADCLNNIIFMGMLEVNTVKKFITRADILVSPRILGTNTPLKIYEYMASGIPIVATKLKTHTQELDDDCAYLCEPSPEDFARGILQCLDDREEAARRACNAHKKFEDKYGEQTYLHKIEKILSIAIK